MGRKLVSDKSKQNFKRAMGKMVDSIGKPVTVYTMSTKHECPNCYYDSVNEKSSGKCRWTPMEAAQKQIEWVALGNSTLRYRYFLTGRCPVCSGIGFLSVLRRKRINCIVNWGGNRDRNDIMQTPAGKEGATEILIKTDPKYYELFKNCNYINIDDIDCELSNPPFIRGPGNDSILIVVAYTSEDLKKGKSSIRKGYYDK